MVLRFFLICLLLFLPANALFLAGQSEQGGEISILCEGQSSAFLSVPSGELLVLPLDGDFQASFSPSSSGPHTFQCGNETKTVSVSLPSGGGPAAYPGGENIFLVAGMALVFLAALLMAARVFLRPRTTFSKSASCGRVRLCLCAAEDLQEIKISDPQGGEDGGPLELFIPHLRCGAAWSWEYESNGEPPIAARLSAKCARGTIRLFSDQGKDGVIMKKAAEAGKRGNRKLAKCRD